jgi:hypothetical protein
VERGFYAPQVCRLLAAFPRDQILFLTSDQLWLDPSGINATLSRFLRRTVTPTEPGYQATVHSPPSTRMAPTLRAGLFELFSSDIAETARLTDLDLSQWLVASYRDAVYRW